MGRPHLGRDRLLASESWANPLNACAASSAPEVTWPMVPSAATNPANCGAGVAP
ncbi:hypothetical protein [Streptomyces sp. NBC_01236]|uniref:hypothetical protein n=1 Tax=Streptomyces sp. NBC_01236 TaxID=2903789 RepID=UPI002E0E78CD|nr:hypothetical protein OG324_03290 [Streptomyces sp. NBC_01236]